MPSEIRVELKDVSRHYQMGRVSVSALGGVSLDIHESEFLVIAGPSGSGKTTLLNIIGLIDKPTSGDVWLGADNISRKSLNSLARLRRDKLGYVFQTFNLIPVLNVFENVEYPLVLKKIARGERRERVGAILERTGLYERRKHKPNELSGGERQRVSIARAVVKNPEIVLADEPTANLDSRTGIAVVELMERLNTDEGITFVFSSHDPLIISKGRRVVHLKDGQLDRIEGGREWRS